MNAWWVFGLALAASCAHVTADSSGPQPGVGVSAAHPVINVQIPQPKNEATHRFKSDAPKDSNAQPKPKVKFIPFPMHNFAQSPPKGLSYYRRTICTNPTKICDFKRPLMNVFLIGDTGGASLDMNPKIGIHFATQVQKRTALAMVKIARKVRPDFYINVGDNSYWVGIDSVTDPRFQSVFEKPYSNGVFLRPWYMIAGNHDHMGNVAAQIKYTTKSGKWSMPGYYYKTRYRIAGKTLIEFLFFDSIVQCGNTADVDARGFYSWMKRVKSKPDAPAPKYQQLANKQYAWVKSQIENSKADYLILVSHYPIHSAGDHGPIECIARLYDPLIQKHNVSMYVSGHDHNMQVFAKPNTQNRGHNVVYVVSGAGSRVDPREKHMQDDGKDLKFYWPKFTQMPFYEKKVRLGNFGFGWGGFNHLAFTPTKAILRTYIEDGKLAHTQTILPRIPKK